MKHIKYLVGSMFLSLILVGALSCSSNDQKDEGASPDVAEAASDAGGSADGAPPADDQGAPPADGAQANNGDQPPADNATAAPDASADSTDAAALDAPPAADGAAATPESKEGDIAAADQPPADPNSPPPGTDAAAPPAVADNTPPPPPSAEPAAPPADTTSPSTSGDAFGAAVPTDSASADAPPKKKTASLQHIKDVPFTKGGQNLNTVYIARDGDTLDSISQKLFGEDRTKALKKGNPTLKKGVKTGDKVYFNSPNRPDDKDKMITVYEDQGLPPSIYTTKDGDTLKSLSQEWYGTEASYKEIYAINKSLASPKELPSGTELQYWPGSATVAVYGAKKEADVAQANPPPPPAQAPVAPPPPPGNPPPPAGMPGDMNNPANTMANNNVPPGGAAAGTMGAPPPAPPPEMNGMPPKSHKTKDLGSTGAMDKDTIFYAGLAGILLISSALWFALRRRRSRNGGVTQI